MPDSWYKALGEKHPDIGAQSKGSAQYTWVARSSQALAKASTGDVYLLATPLTNIYTLPYDSNDQDWGWRGAHNVWSDYEFAALQANTEVTAIYSVNSETLEIDKTAAGSWVRSPAHGANAAYAIDADTVTPASIDQLKAAWKAKNCKRGTTSSAGAVSCAIGTSSSTASPTTLSTITKSSTSSVGTDTATATLAPSKTTSSARNASSTTSSKAKATACAKGKC